MLLLKLLADIACNSTHCHWRRQNKKRKKGWTLCAVAPIFTHCGNESPTHFFFKSEQKEKKWDPFPLPVYKAIPKTVFRPCLQSELENRSQGKSTSVKKLGVY